MRIFSKAIAAAAAGIMMLGGIGASIPTASAAPGGNLVTFGDSFTANPDQLLNTLRNTPIANGYPNREGCLQAPNNWPRKLAGQTGKRLEDWSCTAQTSRSMLPRVDRAIAHGHIRNDSTVVFAIGMNNYGPFGALDGTNIISPSQVRANYLGDMRAAAAKVRRVAPNAKIVVSGALPAADRETAKFCAVNVIPNAPAGLPVPILRDVENWNRGNQIAAAGQIGATHVDMIDGARGHTTCAPDNQRYVAGIIDTTTPNYNMAFHPTDRGSAYMANKLAPHVR